MTNSSVATLFAFEPENTRYLLIWGWIFAFLCPIGGLVIGCRMLYRQDLRSVPLLIVSFVVGAVWMAIAG